jgi:hypothetical protein
VANSGTPRTWKFITGVDLVLFPVLPSGTKLGPAGLSSTVKTTLFDVGAR